MDIVDVNELGVRVAVFELRARDSRCRFTVYPMIHLADPAFYTEVATRLRKHDLVVAEGVRGGSTWMKVLTSVYRFAALNRRLGLQLQPASLYDVGVPVVMPDITGAEFDQRWRQIELWERALVFVLAPFYGVYLRLFGSRKFISYHLAFNDDILNLEEPTDSGLDELIGDHRDVLLAKALTHIHDTRRDEEINVAVVYGAGHVRPVVTHMRSRHGYVVTNGTWMTIYDL
ncbi:hypothetical protein [Saccharopolyspora sp. 5N708]|uniref:hypothetical protein n=1 Tax=Saccharopolyspora sp. 5N708 TaxID=3457424 RepID=UPI003FD0FDBD